jgi:hypothetical protein
VTWVGAVNPSSFNLQATLSASSSASSNPPVAPHHPVTCNADLRYHEDGVLECDHARVEAGDPRTQVCLDHTIAILLIECLLKRESHAG